MKILWHENPLRSTLELDDVDRRRLKDAVKIDELEMRLGGAWFHLQEGEFFDVARARSDANPEGVDARAEEMYQIYLIDLQLGDHCGDCTCVPCSCTKCHAESLMEVDTLPGLGKHMASYISRAFTKEGARYGWDDAITIDQVIEKLANYQPGPPSNGWERRTREEYESYWPAWRAQAKAAHDWLVNYKREKLG